MSNDGIADHFTPLTAELGTLNMPPDSYWIYSQDWYKGFELRWKHLSLMYIRINLITMDISLKVTI